MQRELPVASEKDGSKGVLIDVRDSGAGLHWTALGASLKPFTSDSLAGFVSGVAILFSRGLQSSQH